MHINHEVKKSSTTKLTHSFYGRTKKFSIGIEYRLVLTKNKSEADIVLSSGQAGGAPTQIIEVPKDPSKSHPFRQKELIERVNADAGIQINTHDIQCINKVHGIKQKTDFFYQGKVKGSPVQYSQTFANWLVKQYQQDHLFFQKTRTKAKGKS